MKHRIYTRRLLPLAAAAILCCSTACGTGTADDVSGGAGDSAGVVTANGTFPIVEDKISLEVFAPAIPTIIDLDTNEFTKWYEERTNIHIEWVTAPQESAYEVMNTMLAGGDLADIYFGIQVAPSTEEFYGVAEKMFIPLNDLIDQYAPNFKKIMEERPEVAEVLTATDGNIYSLPSIRDSYHCMYSRKCGSISIGWKSSAWKCQPQPRNSAMC